MLAAKRMLATTLVLAVKPWMLAVERILATTLWLAVKLQMLAILVLVFGARTVGLKRMIQG